VRAVEYDTIANGHWTFGSLNAATTSGPAGARLSLYGEIHEGEGDLGTNRFDYSVVAVGLIRTFGPHSRCCSMTGSLTSIPVAAICEDWPDLSLGPRLQTAVAYQHSVSGNLGTNLGLIRVDVYGKPLNWLAGGAYGQGAPAVFNLQTDIIEPGSGRLKEVFVGGRQVVCALGPHRGRGLPGSFGTRRVTLTVNYIFDLRCDRAVK